MEYTRLGRSGCVVSRLALGTMNLGAVADEAESFRIMDRALELGINLFDTANIYGSTLGRGITEALIGRWLAQEPSRRERIVLATKVYHVMEGGGPNRDGGLSAYKIRRELEESLRRLRTDHIDLYQMHRPDRDGTRWEELWNVFSDLTAAGKIIYTGSSNFAAYELAHAQGVADRLGLLGLVSEQQKYSLAVREPELELLPCCQRLGFGLLVFSTLASGFLTREALDPTNKLPEKVMKQIRRRRPQIEAWLDFCKSRSWDPAQVAVAWVLTRPEVTSVLIGPATMAHLETYAEAMHLALDEEALARIEEIFPGPGGPAPNAFFW